MKAIGYVMVSTENQTGEDAYGLETQREAIAKYCQGNGLDLGEVYEDPALSGSPRSIIPARDGCGSGSPRERRDRSVSGLQTRPLCQGPLFYPVDRERGLKIRT